MARTSAMTTETAIENETVTVEIYHGEIGADATADVRCFGLDELTQDVFDEHYEALGEPVDFPTGRVAVRDAETVLDVLEHVWMRTQGGRDDPILPYDGSQVRSSMVGDVVVLDGVPFGVADVGFERVELDVGGEDDQDGGEEDEPELVTDGGVDVDVFRVRVEDTGSNTRTTAWVRAPSAARARAVVRKAYSRGNYVGPAVRRDSAPAGADVLEEDEPELVTDGGVDLPAAQDVDLWDVEEGDEIHLPGGTILEIVEAIHHSRDFGDDSHRFRARKPSGHVVRLESHNLETAFASGGELIKPPTQNPDAIPVDEFYYGDSPRWLAVRHRISYVRRNQYGRDFVTGEKVGQSVVAVDPEDAAI